MLPALRLSTRIEAEAEPRVLFISASGLQLIRIFVSSQLLDKPRSCGTSLPRSISSISSTPSMMIYTGPAELRSVARRLAATVMLFLRSARLDWQSAACRSSPSSASWNIKECNIVKADVLLLKTWLRRAKITRPMVFALLMTVPARNVFPINVIRDGQ